MHKTVLDGHVPSDVVIGSGGEFLHLILHPSKCVALGVY